MRCMNWSNSGTVKCRYQSGELFFLDVLEFIDEQGERGTGSIGGISRGFEQGLKVELQIAIVCESRLGIEIQTYFDVLELPLSAAAKPASPFRARRARSAERS